MFSEPQNWSKHIILCSHVINSSTMAVSCYNLLQSAWAADTSFCSSVSISPRSCFKLMFLLSRSLTLPYTSTLPCTKTLCGDANICDCCHNYVSPLSQECTTLYLPLWDQALDHFVRQTALDELLEWPSYSEETHEYICMNVKRWLPLSTLRPTYLSKRCLATAVSTALRGSSRR